MAPKNRTCNRCGKTFITPRKLRDHENKKFPCQPRVIPTTNPIPAPVVHTRGKDRRREKQKVMLPVPQIDPEAGPGHPKAALRGPAPPVPAVRRS